MCTSAVGAGIGKRYDLFWMVLFRYHVYCVNYNKFPVLIKTTLYNRGLKISNFNCISNVQNKYIINKL